MKNKYAIAGIGLLVVLLNPLSIGWLESRMFTYMLLQIPGLVMAGFLIGKALQSRIPSFIKGSNSGGITGLLLAVFIIGFWILPRNVDLAINSALADGCKFITLILLAGIPLAWSWHQVNGIVKAVIWANLVAMIFVMSWLYLAAPVRICNNFLEVQQIILGKALFLVGAGMALYFIYQCFRERTPAQVVS